MGSVLLTDPRPKAATRRRCAPEAIEPIAPQRRSRIASRSLERIRRIRAQIEAGTYETPARLTIAVDRLIADVGRSPRLARTARAEPCDARCAC